MKPDRKSLVTVVIPCFNYGHFLSAAIESVLAQTHRNLEIIVADDGSTDTTREVSARYPQVQYIYQANAGESAARNTGLRAAGGDYVCFLDADDVLYPEGITLGLACFTQNPGCAFVWGGFRLVAEGGAKVIERLPGSRIVDYRALLDRNWISMIAAVLFRTQVLVSAGGFDRSLRASEDYEVYLRLARELPIAGHQGLVAECRRHGANMSGNLQLMLLTTLRVLHVQRSHCAGNRKLRDALHRGEVLYQEFYGGKILRRVWMDLWAGRFHQAWGELRFVFRHAPHALLAPFVAFPRRVAGGLARRLKPA